MKLGRTCAEWALDIWCDGDIEPLKAYFEFDAVAAPHGPPLVEIDMPASVSCNTPVELEAITTDPQGDHLPVRWEVDGVLLAPSVDEIEIDTSHTIRAMVRDVRGATATDEHAITCTP